MAVGVVVEVDRQGEAAAPAAAAEQLVLQAKVLAAVEAAFASQGVRWGRVELIWTDEPGIRQLNRQFRQIDQATDVLSFPLDAVGIARGEPLAAADSGPEPPELGSMVICWPRVSEQAQAYGHSREREACYLAVHSALHLCGYDHENPTAQAQMRQLEEAALRAVGLGQVHADRAGE